MRNISIIEKDLVLKETVDIVFEKTITPFGNSGKVDVPKKHIGKRAYVIVVND